MSFVVLGLNGDSEYPCVPFASGTPRQDRLRDERAARGTGVRTGIRPLRRAAVVSATGMLLAASGAAAQDPEPDIGTVTLAVSPSSVGEGDGSTVVVVTATANRAVPSATDVTVSVGGGSATSGQDYGSVSDFTVTIPAGSTSGRARFTLTPRQDTSVEGSETISVSGSASDPNVRGTSLMLTDDDRAATSVTLSLNPSSVGEDSGSTSVMATANAAVQSATDVTVAVGGGSATSGQDYGSVSDFTVTIGANQTSGSGTFTLTPTQDTSVEGSETITVSGSASGLSVSGATLTLTDDDRAATSVRLSLKRRRAERIAGQGVQVFRGEYPRPH